MADHPRIERIDNTDPRVVSAVDAETRLFDHYGLEQTTRFVEIDEPNILVRVIETGAGPPLLMVPGGNGIAAELGPLMAELRGRRLIAINLPGGGMSDAVDCRQVDYRQLAVRVITTVLDAFDVDRSPVVAGSIGATWSLWTALAQPDRISKMALFGCPAFLFGSAAPLPMRLLSVPVLNRLLFPLSQPPHPDKFRNVFVKLLGARPDVSREIPDVVPEMFFRMFHLPTYRLGSLSFLETVLTLTGSKQEFQMHADDLSRIRQPVLFIWGGRDTFGPETLGRKAVDAMTDARLHVIDTGHVPYIEQPEECARFIQSFLSDSS